MNRFLLMICFLLCSSFAFAQETNVFPLVSFGNVQNWQAGTDDYRLIIPPLQSTQRVRIEVRSPNMNLADPIARGDFNWYVGDERYDQKIWKTQFIIRTPQQKTLLTQNYGADSRNRWERFWHAPLSAGTYPLEVKSTGNGKNAFVVALQYAKLESSQMTANAFGNLGLERTVAQLNVTAAMIGHGLEIGNYDADGNELEFYLQLPNGQRQRLNSSASRAWALNEILVTKALLGTWTVRAKIASLKQRSNAFTMRFREVARQTVKPFFATVFVTLPTTPPLLTTPRLILGRTNSNIVVPPLPPIGNPPTTPTKPPANSNGIPPTPPTNPNNPTTPTTPTNPTNPTPSNPNNPTNPVNPTPDPNLKADLEIIQVAEPNPVQPNEPFVLTATINNNGANTSSNAVYRVTLPTGLETTSQSSSQGNCTLEQRVLTCQLGTIENGASVTVLVALRSSTASTYDLVGVVSSATNDPNPSNNTDRLTVAVQRAVKPAELRLTRTSIQATPALPGEVVTVPLLLENIGEQPTDYELTESTNPLLEVQKALPSTGRLEIGERRQLEYRATVTAGLPDTATLTATASAPDLRTVTAQTAFTRVNAGLRLRLASTVTPRPGTSIPLEIVVSNPLNRPITLNLTFNASDLNFEPLEPTITLAANETRVIPVAARADIAGDFPISASLSLNTTAVAPDATLSIPVRELPARVRRSEVSLRFTLENIPANAEVIIVDRIPDDATLETDSSRLDTKPLANPLESADYLFWEVGQLRGKHEIVYVLNHTQPLNLPENRAGIIIRLPSQGNRPAQYRVIQGDPAILEAYQRQAQAATTPLPASRLRVGALIVNPASGTVIRNRDQINVLVDLPLKAEQIEFRMNGVLVPKEQAGSTTYDEGTNRLTIEYIAVRLRPGKNELTLRAFDPETKAFVADSSDVFLAGEATKLLIEAVGDLTSDPQDRPTLRLRVLDGNNLTTGDGVLDWFSDPLPLLPDAVPNIAGYQVRYINGVAEIPLSSIQDRTVVRAEARLGDLITKVEFAVVSSQRPWIAIGNAYIAAEITDPFSIGAGLQGFARGSIGNGFLLTIGINLRAAFAPVFEFSGTLEPIANPFERFPLLGDAALRGQDVNSSDPFYIRLERGPSFAMYGSYQAGFVGRLSAYNSRQQGLQLLWRDPVLTLTAFASYQPRATLTNTNASQPFGAPGDGTSLYRLPQAVQSGSERIRIVTRDRDNSGLILAQRELVRLIDYSIDPISGIIFLTKPLSTFDNNNNPQFLLVEYAPATGTAPLEYRFGTQAQVLLGNWRVSGTALAFNPNSSPLVALGLNYTSETLRLESELAYSSDWALSVGGRYKNEAIEALLEYQALGIGYVAVNPSQPASSLRVGLTATPIPDLRLQSTFSTSRSFVTFDTRTDLGAGATQRLGAFSIGLGIVWRWQNTNPNSLGYLLTSGAVNVGRVKFSLEARTPLTSDTPFQIAGAIEYAITDNLKLEIRDTYSFNGNNDGAIALRGTFGTTNVSAAYDLPANSGDAGRARLGIETSIPLSPALTANIGAELNSVIGSSPTISLNTALRLETEDINGTAAAQFAIGVNGLKQVYRLGFILQPKNSQLVISPNLETTFAANGDGLRFSIAGAYRPANLSILTQNQIRTGVYAPNGNEALGEIQSTYSPTERFTIRGGIAYKYASNLFTAQINIATRYWIQDNLGIGAQAIWQFQPNVSSRIAIGLEGTWRITNELGLTIGTNLIGFDSSLGNFSVRPGLYIRLEFLFNEQTFGAK